MAEDELNELRGMTVELAAAYVSNTNVRLDPEDFQKLIRDTFATLSPLTTAQTEQEPAESITPKTKAEIRKSITPDTLISFEDGRPYKTLKRHLTVRGLSPVEYREKHGLPADYPMVAPNYSAARSQMAKNLGLGQKGRRAKVSAKPKSR
ncbi:MucR family transcriptional regulator [Brevundimonas viscosa]|uniref:Transcriptional regulator, MucR family n=1 Tax=Brevundimonas viscosa TaxID=871741 RepID=A0A1I6TED9_9CAUL|nr:MucR family transcriptional regulator [Brevundimonas viscosa]SFS87513.1 transcriptional regulator, MucR family [Brevundimonas viscosa]